MKLKLDENLGGRCVDILSNAGHDVDTVASQQMSGAADKDVLQTCHSESRCLITLDLDFGNPLRFKLLRHRSASFVRPRQPFRIARRRQHICKSA